jgi:release factor glutamine methyltransferase
MSIPAALVARLRAAGCVFAEDEAALLVDAADDQAHLEQLVARRVGGTPLEQVLGWADFCGVRVLLGPGVFVPRQRTALLVEAAVEHLRGRPGAVVLDVGCGSGALAAAVARSSGPLEVWASDVDPAAVACARRNLPPERVVQGDLYAALPPTLRGRADVVLANGPYVPSGEVAGMPPEARDHEHRVALDGGPDGLDLQRRVIAEAPGWLAPGGLVLVETGLPQLGATQALVTAAGLAARVWRDDERGALVVGGYAGSS